MSDPIISTMILISFGVILAQRARLTPLSVSTLQLLPIILGYRTLDGLRGGNLATLYLAGAICLCAGYLTVSALSSGVSKRDGQSRTQRLPPTTADSQRSGSDSSVAEIKWLVAVVTGLTVYHFAVGGIPLLSGEVETARFNFTGSGMLGLPGRMYLYGLPLTVILVTVAFRRRLTRVSRRLVVGVWGLYLAGSLLGGFKGGIASTLLLYLLVCSAGKQPLSLRRLVLGWRLLLLLCSGVCAVIVGLLYQSSRGVDVQDFVGTHLWNRVTVGAAEAGHAAVTRLGSQGQAGTYLLRDCSYFYKKYVAFGKIDQDLDLPLDKTVSAMIYNTPVSTGAFIVSVTLGAFPELIVNFGIIGAMAGMCGIGAGMAVMLARAQTTASPILAGVWTFALFMLQVYIVNGNLVYTAVNTMLVGAFIAAIYIAVRRMRTGHRRSVARLHFVNQRSKKSSNTTATHKDWACDLR